LVRLLAQSGAFVDAQLPSGINALHIAAAIGDVDSIALLLQYGAHKDARNRAGESALDLARHANQAAAASLLV
jgi:ankyrin repeat protein